ncbi:hypothetical protein KC351_g121 [Hortaea werneckii]|nr:hypothetical protein KC351_g121 [Hortaea werneckii]
MIPWTISCLQGILTGSTLVCGITDGTVALQVCCLDLSPSFSCMRFTDSGRMKDGLITRGVWMGCAGEARRFVISYLFSDIDEMEERADLGCRAGTSYHIFAIVSSTFLLILLLLLLPLLVYGIIEVWNISRICGLDPGVVVDSELVALARPSHSDRNITFSSDAKRQSSHFEVSRGVLRCELPSKQLGFPACYIEDYVDRLYHVLHRHDLNVNHCRIALNELALFICCTRVFSTRAELPQCGHDSAHQRRFSVDMFGLLVFHIALLRSLGLACLTPPWLSHKRATSRLIIDRPAQRQVAEDTNRGSSHHTDSEVGYLTPLRVIVLSASRSPAVYSARFNLGEIGEGLAALELRILDHAFTKSIRVAREVTGPLNKSAALQRTARDSVAAHGTDNTGVRKLRLGSDDRVVPSLKVHFTISVSSLAPFANSDLFMADQNLEKSCELSLDVVPHMAERSTDDCALDHRGRGWDRRGSHGQYRFVEERRWNVGEEGSTSFMGFVCLEGEEGHLAEMISWAIRDKI